MDKRKFFSMKYQKYILPGNKDFWNIARDEAIFRLEDNKRMNCSCLQYQELREKLEKFLKQLSVNN